MAHFSSGTGGMGI